MSTMDGQVVIVTGAGKGIGKGIAKLFSQKGASVVIATRGEEEGLQTEQEIIDSGGEACFIQTDVSIEADIIEMVDKTLDRYGKISTLINNAGITVFKSIEEMTVDDWEEIINIDLRGTFLCSKYVIPAMKDQGKGSIINISSNHALSTLPNTEVYAAAKGGVNAMTRSMALSLGSYNIRVNAICPGFTDTPHYRNWLQASNQPKQTENEVLALHATNRISSPEDIAKLSLYLASDDSTMMTGECLVMDGGLSVRLYHAATF
ncbi:SDR family NAD(P)-dependent oxidoreductase [Virgibacillus pantothenticus]|uniref:SDR family NAD(P)-dependent oxidoreductase n=1 Tax=Virgibacillus pantothenticus TaxID=1473 RepID=UPI0009860050|nr:SDR family oxidoreductase [Virgibacillus pantothenticus]